jgi:hypothetical protein
MREFESYESLYQYLVNMTDKDYARRINEIKTYLNSNQIKEFSADTFAKSVSMQISS